ncbi:PAS domain-containing protein [Rhizobiaceae bacterium BDR2-2]|uniref:PAS domain-containing protein n=1 Tax=Ectorhizobium quercum TaxID=2965071 RepID=A0AAE3SV35_9HYPH|nr:PAS domain-containing protein [Ectorhizobium quercum]MCX8997732.1 PAS domain-containing protein [Ectorhizobium quercum]
MYQHMECHEIYAYWDKLRGDAGAPVRNLIEPAALRSVLPDIFMLQMAEDGDLTFRLAGTRMCARFGRELRGCPFEMLWANGRRCNAVEIAQAAVLYENPVLMNLVGFFEDDETRRFDMLLLPLRSPEGRCDRLLGALLPPRGEDRPGLPWTLKYLVMDRSRPLKGHAEDAFPAAFRAAGRSASPLI